MASFSVIPSQGGVTVSPATHYENRKKGNITKAQKKRIMSLLRSGRYTKAEIARSMGVSWNTVHNTLKSDPALMEAWNSGWMETMETVENAMIERAVSCENHMAAQQAGEFILSHGYRDRYDDRMAIDAAAASLPKIVVPLVVPVRDAKPEAAKPQGEVVDAEVVSESPAADAGGGNANA